MTKRFVVVHEASADFITATELADRVLQAEVDWLESGLLDSQRRWIDKDDSGSRLLWSSMGKLSRNRGIRVHGHFGQGAPSLPDANAARRAIVYLCRCVNQIDAILLIRDTDDQPERRRGLEQARADSASPPVVVIGVAVVERESWVISGFNPINEAERRSLDLERQTLGFDPRVCSQQLTACGDDRAKKSPKRVLATLIGDDSERERACWLNAELPVLEERGRENGLADYLNEIRRRLVPMLVRDNRLNG